MCTLHLQGQLHANNGTLCTGRFVMHRIRPPLFDMTSMQKKAAKNAAKKPTAMVTNTS